MKLKNLKRLLPMAISAAALLGTSTVSNAQNPPYRVERLDRSDRPATFYDLNNFGVLAGTLTVNGVSQAHLFPHSSLFFGTPYIPLAPVSAGNTIAKAVNDMGEAAGSLSHFGFDQRAALFRDEQVTELGTLGGPFSFASGINNHSSVIGSSRNAQSIDLGFLWKDGQMAALPTLGGQSNVARSINDAGVVVGSSQTSSPWSESHATSWQNGVATDLGTLGGVNSAALDINKSGHIVGWSEINVSSGTRHATLWYNGAATDLGKLNGTTGSEATSINDVGVVVGRCYTGVGDESRAFVFRNGQMSDLTTLVGGPVVFTHAISVNYEGQILARGMEYGQQGTYLLSPFWYNAPPQPQTDSVQVLEDSADNTIRVLDNDFDADQNRMMVLQVSQGQNGGTVKRTDLDTLTYTPPAGYAGPDNFTYVVVDSRGDANLGHVSVFVAPVNDAPSFTPGPDVTINENQETRIPNWATNISPGPEDEARFQWVHFEVVPSDPSAFYYIYLQGDGTLVASPTFNYNGTTSVTVKAVDNGGTDNGGQNSSASHTLNITVQDVNNVPVAQNSEVTLNEDESTVVFLNVSDADNEPVTSVIVSGPQNGTLEKLWSDLVYGYKPNADFNGTDSFTFKVNDGKADSNVATVTLKVTPVDDPLTAQEQNLETDEDQPLSITLGASDPDGNAIEYSIASQPSRGTLSGTAPNLVYIPNANFNGSDSFTFSASDGKSSSSTATISIIVKPVNDAPVAASQNIETNEDTPVNISLGASDADGDAIEYSIVSVPSNGSLSGTAPNLVYTPNANYNGSDSFSFKASDGNSSSTATISITVKPQNDAPVAASQNIQTNEDSPVNISLSATDVDGDSLEYSIASGPSNGTLSGSGANRIYTPNANYNGSDSFSFAANDGEASDTAIISINVKPVNDAPVANAGADQTVELQGLTASVQLDGSASRDLDGDALSYTWREGSTVLATGVRPTVNLAEGVHTITLTVTDAGNASSSDTVVITVQKPSSTVGGSIKAEGKIEVTGGKIEVNFQGEFNKGKLKGKVSYTDSRNGGYKLSSSSIQSVVISGTTGRIFGTGIVKVGRTSRAVTFVITGNDLFDSKAKRGDTISLQVSDGYSFSGALTKGDVRVSGS